MAEKLSGPMLKARKQLLLGEPEEAFLVRPHLVQVDMREAGIQVGLDLRDVDLHVP